jgi:hypothetical protein
VIKPEISGESLRLTYAGMRRNVSHCEVEGPICFMIKRALDRHVGNGERIQTFLDEGLNAALRPIFRAAAQSYCAEGRGSPREVRTAPEFLEVLIRDSGEAPCATGAQASVPSEERADFLKELHTSRPGVRR